MKKDNTLFELLAGIFSLGILLQVILLVFWEHPLYHAVGLWCGIGVSAFCTIHMKRSLDEAVDLGEEYAPKYMRKGYAFRMLLAGVVVALVLYFEWGNPITILIGIVMLKPAVYMQPLLHGVFERILKKGG